MKCIDCYSLRSPMLSECRYMQEIKTAKFFCFSMEKSAWIRNRFSVRTRALPSSPFLAAVPAAASPDLAVFLRTSALLLFAYWIANFVVPRMVYKDLQFDKTNENESPNDENFSDD